MMLRITIVEDAESQTFRLEGSLAGAWVREAEECCQRTRTSQRKSLLRFDLTGLTYVDAAGRAFLASTHAQGAELIASGCLMRAIVAELTNTPRHDCGNPKGIDQTES